MPTLAARRTARPLTAAALAAATAVAFAASQQGRPPAPGEPIQPSEPIRPPDIPGAPAEDAAALWPREVLPGIRAHRTERWIEFDGIVPIVTSADPPPTNAPNAAPPDPPDVLLELIVTSRGGGRDHESLVLTDARPSHVHAALLLIGLQPGAPGRWNERIAQDRSIVADPIPPEGPPLAIEIRYTDPATDEPRSTHPAAWVRHIETGEQLPVERWLFAGSHFVRRQGEERYDADFTGTLIGLAQFGSEVIANPSPYHHDQAFQTPIWFADNEDVPPFGTDVTVRIRPASPAKDPPDPATEAPAEADG